MPVGLSSDTLVNTQALRDQRAADVAGLEGGGAVAAWFDSSSEDGGTANFRVIADDGTLVSGERSVGAASDVAVAGLKGGGFVVVWSSTSGALTSVFAQVHDAAGRPVGDVDILQQTRFEPPTLDMQAYGLNVVGLSDGGFAVAFATGSHDASGSSSVTGHVVVAGPDGAVEGHEFRGGASGRTATGFDPLFELAELPGGQVFATWTSHFDGRGWTQYASLFDLDGEPVGAAREIGHREYGQTGAGDFVAGKAVALPSGDVAMVWHVDGRLWVSVYPADSLAAGGAGGRTPPQEVTSGPLGELAVSVTQDGQLAVTWAQDGDVFARLFDAEGLPMGAAFPVGDVALGVQDAPQVAGLGDGRFLAVWTDQSGQGGDADGRAVKAQVVWLGEAQPGTAAGDSMTGGAGDDAFAGLEGADTLRGGGGADTLAGGPGGDVFVLAADGSVDRILDFSGASGDRLDLRDAGGAVIREGLLILDEATGRLAWDRDDAGALPPTQLGFIGVDGLSRASLAEGVRLDGVRVLLDGGGRADTIFDWGEAPFEQATSTLDAQQRVTTYFVRNDDGSTGQRWWDAQATQAWSTRAVEHDAAGQVKAYAVTYDDGHTELFLFDVANSQPWSRVVEFYDAEGRLSVQAAAFDDGAATERYEDTYDVHPWAFYIDTYRDGGLISHTAYNADGSVFVG